MSKISYTEHVKTQTPITYRATELLIYVYLRSEVLQVLARLLGQGDGGAAVGLGLGELLCLRFNPPAAYHERPNIGYVLKKE